MQGAADPPLRSPRPASSHWRTALTRARCVAGDVPMIKAILVVDADGKRIMARYYGAPEFPTGEAETTFEKKLYDKTMRTNAKNEGALARLESPLAPALCHPSRRPRVPEAARPA